MSSNFFIFLLEKQVMINIDASDLDFIKIAYEEKLSQRYMKNLLILS
jgi:hypothetical protein